MLFGDRGHIVSFEYVGGVPTATVVERLGGGGPGDFTDGVIRNPDQFVSVDPTVGGDDVIDGMEGDNVLVGGAGTDTLGAGAGDDVMLGDNGIARFTTDGSGNAILTLAQTTDTVDQPTWGDIIVTGGGDNVVLAGMGADHVNDPVVSPTAVPSAGNDIVLGDNGQFQWDVLGNPTGFMSTGVGPIYAPTSGIANPFNGVDIGSLSAPAFGDVDGDGDLDAVVGGSDGTLAYFEKTIAGYVQRTGAANPFDGFDAGTSSAPALVDLGADGDLDLVVGSADGTLAYLENTGTGFVQRTGTLNPFSSVDVGDMSTPTFVDLDGDGDRDLVVGALDGTLASFENTGTGFAPLAGAGSAPALVDVDGDGDRDLVVGNSAGTLDYYENTGTAAAPVYVQRTGAANPFGSLDAGESSTPTAADVDGDGDLDLVTGNAAGTLAYFERTATGYIERTGAANPFDGIDAGSLSAPVLGDLDGDGDLDVVLGASDGTVRYFQRTATGYIELTGAANPFNGFDVGAAGAPALVDLNGDGDLDLVVGAADGTLLAFENTGTAAAPAYAALIGAANPFNGIDVGAQSMPAFFNLDGDAALELVIGAADGTLRAYDRNGAAWVAMSVNPFAGIDAGTGSLFGGIDVGSSSTPAFADLDTDGDLDLVVGAADGTISTFESMAAGYVAQTGPNNPFDGIDVGISATPSFADLDGDGDADTIIGVSGGGLAYYENTSLGSGGDDVVVVGDGANIVVGGFGADTITAGAGDDLLLGDNAAVTYTTGTPELLQAASTDPVNATGGNDIIAAGEGDNVLIAGVGSDTVTAGAGDDLILGDNGRIDWTGTPTHVYDLFQTADPTLGAGDSIQAGDGDNIVAGGFGADTIATGVGEDLILGDNGLFDFTEVLGEAVLTQASTTDTVAGTGGDDLITSGGTPATVFVNLTGDASLDAVLGTADGTLRYFENTPTGYVELFGALNPFDGIDVGTDAVPAFANLDGDADLELVIGAGDGVVTTYDKVGSTYVAMALAPFDGTDFGDAAAPALADLNGDGFVDLVIGNDLGQLAVYSGPAYGAGANPFAGVDVGTNSVPTLIDLDGDGDLDAMIANAGGTTTFLENIGTLTAPAYAPGTTLASPYAGIEVTSSDNIVLAGVGNDQVNQNGVASAGEDIVLGDNGTVTWDSNGLITGFASTELALGGNDQIAVGDGSNIVVGGVGNDTITSGSGADVLIGDSAAVTYTPGTEQPLQAVSTDAADFAGGNNDVIAGGNGDNIVIGGLGTDTVTAGAGDDLILGDNGQIEWTPSGVYEAFQTTDPTLGAGDNIQAGDGDNIVAGGFGADTIATGVGEDLILGDNGSFQFTEVGGVAVLTSATTTDTDPATGAGDTITSGGTPATVFTDVDGDGDLDAVVGSADGTLRYFESTPAGYVERVGVLNPFDSIDVGTDAVPTFVNLDGDADLELVVGAGDGVVTTYDKVGGEYVPVALAPFDGVDFGTAAAPAVADVNGDGFLDLVIGEAGGTLTTFTGPAFGPAAADPFAGIDVGANSVPSFIDLDGDGDLDLMIANAAGATTFVENTGSAAAPAYAPTTALADPFAGIDVTGSGNIVLAGLGDDLVNQNGVASAGEDIVIGDNGFVSWDASGQLTQFGSTEPLLGGNDTINVGDGGNIVIGGFGADAITTGTGADIVLGDDGQVDYVTTDGNSADIDSITSTSTTAGGGADTIVTGNGDDIVIGGRFDDTIDAGNGDNLVIGDSGQIIADTVDAPQMAGQPITLGSVASIELGDGGNDTITTGTGDDIVIGGFGGDTLTSDEGADVVFGDNGLIDYDNAVPTLLVSTDTDASTGGDDVIDAGNGDNSVFGGVGADTVTTGSGADVVFGDNGTIVNYPDGTLQEAITGDPALGGDDTLSTGDGNDIVMGGAGNDTVLSAGGNDILFGDGGSVALNPGGSSVLIQTVDPGIGGDDTIDGGAGNDVLIGGQGLDLLFGSLSEDLLFGSNAALTLSGGIVTSIETDMQDLVSEALFKSFNGGDDDEEETEGLLSVLPGYAAIVPGLLELLAMYGAELDAAMFRKLFQLAVASALGADGGSSEFAAVFDSGLATADEPVAHGD
jgi:hypothetical protein